MKSLPEIIVGKPWKSWGPRDAWVLRGLFTAAGMGLLLILVFALDLLQSGRRWLPWGILRGLSLPFGAALFVLFYRTIKSPPDSENRP